jgi:hypothetical protein
VRGLRVHPFRSWILESELRAAQSVSNRLIVLREIVADGACANDSIVTNKTRATNKTRKSSNHRNKKLMIVWNEKICRESFVFCCPRNT